MAGDSAVDKTFDTIELLEAILLELPARDLLLSRSVCHTWQAVIDSSRKIQQCLFYRPIGLIEPSYGEFDGADADPASVYEDALHGVPPTLYKGIDGSVFVSAIFENPFFHSRGLWHTDQWAARFHGDLFAQTLGIPRLGDLQVWDRPRASWKKMLVCQPAMKRIRMCGGGRFVDLRSRNGVTAGMVFKVVKRWRRKFGPFFRHVMIVGRRQWRVDYKNEELVKVAEAMTRRSLPSV